MDLETTTRQAGEIWHKIKHGSRISPGDMALFGTLFDDIYKEIVGAAPKKYPRVTCPACERKYDAVGCYECPACTHEWDENDADGYAAETGWRDRKAI